MEQLTRGKIKVNFRRLKEETGIPYTGMAKAAGIHFKDFQRYLKAESIPMKNAAVLSFQLQETLIRGNSNAMLNCNRKGDIILNDKSEIPATVSVQFKNNEWFWKLRNNSRLPDDDPELFEITKLTRAAFYNGKRSPIYDGEKKIAVIQ